MNKREVGEALDRLESDVRVNARDLVAQYRKFPANFGVLKQAVDTPRRARAQISAWISAYNAANGAGTAQTFLASCLTVAGSTKTLASIDTALASLESQAQALVNHRNNDGWTWDQIAAAVESGVSLPTDADLSYDRLPIPAGYTTVWGEPW
jgi:hypothetical protein